METKKNILVTGAAGFIGYHLCESLLKLGYCVVGLDNINSYYDRKLKYDRLSQLGIRREDSEVFDNICLSELHGKKMQFIRMNLEDRVNLPKLFMKFKFTSVCNLAAQAGVRYSIEKPEKYVDSNLNGFFNILECCRNFSIKRLVYASSSSVYGNSTDIPFKESINVDKPISLYAATKKSNELMAFTYSHLFKIETIGLRFFTVYGPWGRPDMAMFLFTDAIINNKPIKVFNKGKLSRDFTYIDDVIEGLVNTIDIDFKVSDKYKLYNIGNNSPVKLTDFIDLIESKLGIKAQKEILPMQPGDVEQTWANVDNLQSDYNYSPDTPIEIGINAFINWYKSYYSKD